jgi:ribosomal protein S18 acetylase RimI-like enzyme
LITGYTSYAKYRVTKIENEQETVIQMRIVHLEQPYVKLWPPAPEDIERCRGVARLGFSLAAFDNDRVVGFAIAEPQRWNRSLLVWELAVNEQYRRQGIGTRLMDSLSLVAARNGLRVLVCETQTTNIPAILFYRKAGFHVEGIDLSYYTNQDVPEGEVAVFMKRRIEG